MVFLLDNYILAPFFLLFYEICGVPKTNDVKKGNLRISRCYDITHETVVTPATDFDILRKCSIKDFRPGDHNFVPHFFA